MSHDFQENGERLLKDTRADVALAHQRIERLDRKMFYLGVAFGFAGLLLAITGWCVQAEMAQAACRCRIPQEVLFVEK